MIALNFWLLNSAHPLAGTWLKPASAPTGEPKARSALVPAQVTASPHQALRLPRAQNLLDADADLQTMQA